MRYRENWAMALLLALIGFIWPSKTIDWGIDGAGRGAGAQGLPACALSGQARMPVATCTFTRDAPGKGEWDENRYFYETKPTSLIEST